MPRRPWDPVPSAILFMADYGVSQINSIISPIWEGTQVSDNAYADVTGDDLPDFAVARLCESSQQGMTELVDKILEYEKHPPMEPAYYDEPLISCCYEPDRWFQLCAESVAGYFEKVHGKTPRRKYSVSEGDPFTHG